MRVIDEATQQEIANPDLNAGELRKAMWASSEAYATIDNVVKFALDDDDYEEVQLYHAWTAEEIEQREESKREAEKAIERETLLGELPDTLADSDAAICELYETTLAQSDTIAEQDAAICELYEMIMEV